MDARQMPNFHGLGGRRLIQDMHSTAVIFACPALRAVLLSFRHNSSMRVGLSKFVAVWPRNQIFSGTIANLYLLSLLLSLLFLQQFSITSGGRHE